MMTANASTAGRIARRVPEPHPSPAATFAQHAARGQLAFQVDADGTPVFHPRVGPYAWRVSEGHGTVYATTTVRRRGEEPYDVSLIDLDEGFRMMARVEGLDPQDVRIGMRVRVRFAGDDAAPVPVFSAA
jgi:hypothetical protein